MGDDGVQAEEKENGSIYLGKNSRRVEDVSDIMSPQSEKIFFGENFFEDCEIVVEIFYATFVSLIFTLYNIV